uniref:Phospholipid/glycerol acyltransferase domain-containing protein n=1 Tax=Kalanchoe fedtschenkoi TaxID=63787 RepID=A0A7N0UGV4_KALFE
MVSKALSRCLSFTSRLILRQLRTNSSKFLSRKPGNVSRSSKFHMLSSVPDGGEPELLQNTSMIWNIEGGLLKSSNLFPYFMLVALEAGGFLRALLLLALYPLLCLVGSEDARMKMMVMVCFFGVRKDSFRIGASVLAKFFLQDVGSEWFERMMNKKRVVKKIGVSNMPQIMIESFLKEYMGFDCVVGRELKVFRGYFVGLMEKNKTPQNLSAHVMDGEETHKHNYMVIGICSAETSAADQLVSVCDEIYLTTDAERSRWSQLPADKYPKPLVFHDGRLAFRPTSLATLAMFVWFPFGVWLAILRSLVGLFLPYTISKPLLAFLGLKVRFKPNSLAMLASKSKGIVYVCNHRTLFDPIYLCVVLDKEVTAVTYSLSRVSEFLSPIKTVRLTRDLNKDAKLMEQMLTQGDLVVCPEGTTCREGYLLRFSPLFTEMSQVIVPVALDTKVSMFYGTTASGLKCLDPFFFLMNPCPLYTVKFLDPVSGLPTSPSAVHDASAKGRDSRRFELANQVQSEIAKALNFTCTKLTRKDKYLILAGNEGTVST